MSMHQRPLGRTGLNVTEIGYGAWGIGADMWKGAQDDHSLDALRRYVELGGNFIDTAMGYGSGHSERLVGQVVREHPGTLVATDRKSTRLNSSHIPLSRMPSSA